MAEATIGHLIQTLREEGEKNRTTEMGSGVFIGNEIRELKGVFTSYFKMMQQQSLDDLETEREKKTEKVAPATNFGGMVGDASDKGFLGIIAGVLAAISGFLIGAVEGIVRAFTLTARGVNALLKGYPATILKSITNITKNIFRPIIGFFDAIGDAYRKAGTGKLVRNRQFLGRGLAPITNFFTGLKGFFKAAIPFRGITTELPKATSGVKAFLKSMVVIPEFGKFFKDIAKLKEVFIPLKKAGEATGDGIGIIGRFMNAIGGTFKSIVNAVKPLFGVFRTLGRVVFFPLTVIMSVFDSIKGAMEGFKDEGFLGGILGAIGGLARGLIGMPLDLLKSGISFIAGKLGFENFSEMLDSFSFSDMIFGLFMKVANVTNEIFSNLFSGFKDGFSAGMKQMLQTLMIYSKRLLLFPVAVMAGGVAAIAAALPGGKSPLEAFSETFNKVITVGEGSVATTLPSDQVSGDEGEPPRRRTQGREFAEEIERKRKEVDRMERQTAGGMAVSNVNAPTTINNSSSTAVFSDPSPAVDDLDRVDDF